MHQIPTSFQSLVPGSIVAVHFSTSLNSFIIVTKEANIYIYNSNLSQQASQISIPNSTIVSSALSNDMVYVAGPHKAITAISIHPQTLQMTIESAIHTFSSSSDLVQASQQGPYIFIHGKERGISQSLLYKHPSTGTPHTIPLTNTIISSVAFSPNNKRLAIISTTGTLTLFDTTTIESVYTTQLPSPPASCKLSRPFSLCWTHDSTYICTAFNDNLTIVNTSSNYLTISLSVSPTPTTPQTPSLASLIRPIAIQPFTTNKKNYIISLTSSNHLVICSLDPLPSIIRCMGLETSDTSQAEILEEFTSTGLLSYNNGSDALFYDAHHIALISDIISLHVPALLTPSPSMQSADDDDDDNDRHSSRTPSKPSHSTPSKSSYHATPTRRAIVDDDSDGDGGDASLKTTHHLPDQVEDDQDALLAYIQKHTTPQSSKKKRKSLQQYAKDSDDEMDDHPIHSLKKSKQSGYSSSDGQYSELGLPIPQDLPILPAIPPELSSEYAGKLADAFLPYITTQLQTWRSTIQLQPAFMPTSTKLVIDKQSGYGLRFLHVSEHGSILAKEDILARSITIHAKAGNTASFTAFPTTDQITMATMNDKGYCFAAERIVNKKGVARPSIFHYQSIDSSLHDNDFSVTMPGAESIKCIALSKDIIAVATNLNFVRFFALNEIELRIIPLPGPIVTMAAKNNLLAVYHHSNQLCAPDQQAITVRIYNTETLQLLHTGPVPITPSKRLVWAYISPSGINYTCDDAGVVSALLASEGWEWVVICFADTLVYEQGYHAWPTHVLYTDDNPREKDNGHMLYFYEGYKQRSPVPSLRMAPPKPRHMTMPFVSLSGFTPTDETDEAKAQRKIEYSIHERLLWNNYLLTHGMQPPQSVSLQIESVWISLARSCIAHDSGNISKIISYASRIQQLDLLRKLIEWVNTQTQIAQHDVVMKELAQLLSAKAYKQQHGQYPYIVNKNLTTVVKPHNPTYAQPTVVPTDPFTPSSRVAANPFQTPGSQARKPAMALPDTSSRPLPSSSKTPNQATNSAPKPAAQATPSADYNPFAKRA